MAAIISAPHHHLLQSGLTSVKYITVDCAERCYVGVAMSEIRQFPAHQDVETAQNTSRLSFLLEFLVIVALAALAAYAASA
jgi:hypothetical protein